MNALLDAVDANNECVKLFEDGRITDGLLALRRAYAGLWPSSSSSSSSAKASTGSRGVGRYSCPSKQPQSPPQNARHDDVERKFPIDERMRDVNACYYSKTNSAATAAAASAAASTDATTTRRSCGLHHGHFYIYDRILLLPCDIDEASTFESIKAFDFTVRVSILFNFALGYHIQAMQCGDQGGAKLLKIASKLYDVVLSALDEQTSDEDMSIRVLKCLTLNNRAQIHYEHGDYDDCMDCIDEMCLLLMSSDGLESYIDAEDVVEIRRNIKYIEPPTTAGAA